MRREGGASSNRQQRPLTEPSRRTGSSAFADDDTECEYSNEENP